MKKILIMALAAIMIVFAFTGCMPSNADESGDTVAQVDATDVTIHENEEKPLDEQSTDFGAKGALGGADYTIEEMLRYAIEDEYLARQEYELIIGEYGDIRPFTNIIRAEENHIAWLKDIYDKYDLDIPEDTAIEYAVIPESLDLTYEVGVQAEIDNIAMYDMFLQEDLPDDVRTLFTELRDASKNHLAAFEKGPRGQGNN